MIIAIQRGATSLRITSSGRETPPAAYSAKEVSIAPREFTR